MIQKRACHSVFCLIVVLLMPMSFISGCSQDETAGLITAGAEASTVAAMLTVKVELPDEADKINSALNIACTQANEILKDTKSATTLRQVLDLSFSTDPLLEKIKPVVDFCLPVLNTVPGVTAAMDKPISQLNSTINAYAQAFFDGIAAGLSVPVGTTVESLQKSDSKVAKALKRSDGRFDADALASRLRSLKKK